MGPLGCREQPVDVAGLAELDAAVEHLADRRRVGGDDRGSAGQRLHQRKSEPLVLVREHERMRARVDRRQVVVGDLVGQRHVGQLVRPGAGGADEDQRHRAFGLGERGDAACAAPGVCMLPTHRR